MKVVPDQALKHYSISTLNDQDSVNQSYVTILQRKGRAFGKKNFFKDDFLILSLYNFFEDVFLLFLFHPLIVLSSLYLFATRLGIIILGKDNLGKSREDDPKTKAQRDTNREDNLDTGIDKDKKTKEDDLSLETDINVKVDREKRANNLDIRIVANVGANNLKQS